MNIYQRINEVRKEVAYIKRGSAGQGTGVLYDEVVARARESMVNHGIIVTTDFIADTSRRVMQNSGKEAYIYEAFIRVWYINADEPTDRFSNDIVAHAMDSGDKAPGKANTYATKTSLVKTLFLETGINDESRVHVEPAVSLVSDVEISVIQEAAKEKGIDIDKIKSAYGLSDLSELSLERFPEVLRKINKTEAK